MLRFLADENFNFDIVRGVRRSASIDIVLVQNEGLGGAKDPAILEWAAGTGRVLLTHDAATMSRYAFDRVRIGLPMPGVFEVANDVPVKLAIEEILILAERSLPNEWEGQVRYIPLQ